MHLTLHSLHAVRTRIQDESGFTLIELLVVVLIIGVLAAIALPTFLGQRAKAQDSSAKSDARNAVSQMESCFTDAQTYVVASCPATVVAPATFPVAATIDTYTVRGTSASGNTFDITRTATGAYVRTCSTTGGKTGAGCPSNGSW